MTTQTIWGAPAQGTLTTTMRLPVDTSNTSGPGSVQGLDVMNGVLGNIVAGTSITISPNTATGTLTINSTASGGSGTVTGPGTSTDTAVALFSGTAGQTLENSLITSNVSTGATLITSSSSTALAVGPSTSAGFVVDTGSSPAVVGTLRIASTAVTFTSGGLLTLTSTGNNTAYLVCPGSQVAGIANGTTSTGHRVIVANNGIQMATVANSTTNARLLYTGAADTAITAGSNAISIQWNMGQTRQHATGAIATQQDMVINPSVHSAVGASTITNAAALAITGGPSAGANMTITNAYALQIVSGATTFGGGVAMPSRTVTTSQAVNPSDFTMRCDCTSGAIALTFTAFTLAAYNNQILNIKKIDSSANAVTLSGITVDGVANPTITTQYTNFNIQWNGSTWDKL